MAHNRYHLTGQGLGSEQNRFGVIKEIGSLNRIAPPVAAPPPFNFQDWLNAQGLGAKSGGTANNYAAENANAIRDDERAAFESKRAYDFDRGQALLTWSDKQAQIKAENEAAKLGKTNFDAQMAALQKRFDDGGYATAFNEQLQGLQDLSDTNRGAIDTQLQNSLTGLGQGFDAAQGQTARGYDALDAFLQDNPNDQFAGQSVSAGQVGNDLSALLSSQGASNAPVDQQVAATNANLQSGTQQMNNLMSLFSRIAQQSAGSRKLESQSGRKESAVALAQQRAGGEDKLRVGAFSALQQMLNDIATQTIGVKGAAANAKRAFEDKLFDFAGQDPGVTPDFIPTDTPAHLLPKLSTPTVTAGSTPAGTKVKSAEKPPPAGKGLHWVKVGNSWVSTKNKK